MLWSIPSIMTSQRAAGNGYTSYSTITINYTKVPNTDQTDFPLMVMGTYSFFKTVANGGYVTNSSGYDIIFTSDSGGANKLKWETVYWNGTTGEVKYFVKIPTLSHTANTIIYVWYGNSSVTTDQSDKANTWDSGFYSVLHFGDGTTFSSADSKGTVTYTNNGVTEASGSTGIGAASFNGSSNFLNGGNSFGLTGDLTINLWSYATNVVSILAKVPVGTGKANPIKFGYYGGTNKMGLSLGDGTNETISSSNTLQNASTWTHIGVKLSGTTYTFFFNGATDGSGTNAQSRSDNGSINATIGTNSGVGTEWYAGKIDEFWVSTTARSNDWIATVYNNQHAPETFYLITPAIYLLDTYSAKYGYSLRKLKSTATSAIRVNRSSDSTEQDIGFDSNGDFDITSYNTFVGGGTGRVMKWYDQSGNGNHLNGNGVVAEVPVFVTNIFGTRPGLSFDGVNDAMSSTNNPYFSSAASASIFQVFKIPTDPNPTANLTGPVFYCTGDSTADNHLPWTDGTIYDSTFSTTRKSTANPSPTLTNTSLYTIMSGPSDWRNYINNTLLYSTSTNTFSNAGFTGKAWIGVSTFAFRWFPGYTGEIIVFDRMVSSSDRNSISDNISDYYTIK